MRLELHRRLSPALPAAGRRRCCAGLLLGGLLCGASWRPALAEAVHEPHEWLARLREAAVRRNYQGVLVSTAGAQMSSVRIVHFVDGHRHLERLESLDGEPRSVLRIDETVHTIWPRAQVTVTEPRLPGRGSFPALPEGAPAQVTASYALETGGQDRVAGRDAEVLLLRARDALRYSQRLWVDRASGLMLRAEVMGESGQVLESTAFSELTVGGRAQPERVLGTLRAAEGFRVLRPLRQPVRLADEGWRLSELPTGFRETLCARRTLGPGASAPVVLQAVFSDGVTHVSLFVEPYAPDRHPSEGLASQGATHSLTQRRGAQWITVVGDVPAATLRRFADALVAQEEARR